MSANQDLTWSATEAPTETPSEAVAIAEALASFLPQHFALPHVLKEGAPPPTLRYLRTGGSGHVFTVVGEDLARGYCVKVLKADRAARQDACAAFGAEPHWLGKIQEQTQDLWRLMGADADARQPMVPEIAHSKTEQAVIEVPVSRLGQDCKLPLFVLERGVTVSELLRPDGKTLDAWQLRRREWFWKWYGKDGPGRMDEVLLEMLRQVDLILQAMHQRIGFHLDIKAENILAIFLEPNRAPDTPPRTGPAIRFCLFDFGSFKTIADFAHSPQERYFESTFDTLPEPVRALVSLREQTSDKRVRVPINRVVSQKLRGDDIDRHQLGQLVLDVFAGDQPYGQVRQVIRRDGRRLLLELAKSLLYSEDETDPGRITPGTRNIGELSRKIETARHAVNRVGGSTLILLPGSLLQGVDERLEALTQQPLFDRLKKVRQLGLSYLIYPGATHTRYEHLLGAFHSARDYLTHLLAPSGSPWLAARITNEQVVLCLLHALCHDLGHYPYAHYVEDTGLFPDHSRISKWILTRNEKELGLLCDGSDCGREHLPGKCGWRLVEPEHLASLHAVLFANYGLHSSDWSKWFDALSDSKKRPRGAEKGVFKVLSEVLDGPIDVDKYDYVRRDSLHCGFASIGGVETDLFLRSLTVCADPSPDAVVERYVLGVRADAHCVLEQLALARYHLYSLVYWNPHCRRLTSLLRDALVGWAARRLEAGAISDVWDLVAQWVRSESDDGVMSRLRTLGDPALSSRIQQLLEGPPPRMIAEIGEGQRAAFDGMRLAALDGSKPLPKERPAWAGSEIRLGGSAMREALARQLSVVVGSRDDAAADIDVLVDVPMQRIDRPSEVKGCGVVLPSGEVQAPGPVWGAIEPAVDHWVRRIRVFLASPSIDPAMADDLQTRVSDLYH